MSEEDRTYWADWLEERQDDPGGAAEAFLDGYTFPPGRAGKATREYEFQWWTLVWKAAALAVPTSPQAEHPSVVPAQVDGRRILSWADLPIRLSAA